jgi:hypothetical protein
MGFSFQTRTHRCAYSAVRTRNSGRCAERQQMGAIERSFRKAPIGAICAAIPARPSVAFYNLPLTRNDSKLVAP